MIKPEITSAIIEIQENGSKKITATLKDGREIVRYTSIPTTYKFKINLKDNK